ncbi:Glutaredoxin [Escherichia phage EcS1]|uniref:Glutaredoxin n=1 Tax=Escherichia phage EcS1 TaxID=2083276 RepID=A0A2Z5ZCC4_9CAUD|nr:Glutaredoxin [Escherichia phage EcS1]BBC78116.1 Glutaredoxin [Escherichia phage EcS1]
MDKLKVEIYGIPETVWRCPGCLTATKLLKELEIPFTFYPVVGQTEQGIVHNRPLIVTLAKRAGFPTLSIRYPVIFVNDEKMYNIKYFKDKLIELGYDQDLIED